MLMEACTHLLPGVLRAASAVAADGNEASEEALPRSVACSMMHVLAEACSQYDSSTGSRDRLQSIASLLAALQPSLGDSATNKVCWM